MTKSKEVQDEETEEGAAVVLLAIGATAGLWAWLRSRRQPVGPAFAFALRSQASSQVAATSPTIRPRRDFKAPSPQFGYTDRAGFGFTF